MTDRIEWMLTELSADGYLDAEEQDIHDVLANPDDSRFRFDFVIAVEELDQEWEQNQ